MKNVSGDFFTNEIFSQQDRSMLARSEICLLNGKVGKGRFTGFKTVPICPAARCDGARGKNQRSFYAGAGS